MFISIHSGFFHNNLAVNLKRSQLKYRLKARSYLEGFFGTYFRGDDKSVRALSAPCKMTTP